MHTYTLLADLCSLGTIWYQSIAKLLRKLLGCPIIVFRHPVIMVINCLNERLVIVDIIKLILLTNLGLAVILIFSNMFKPNTWPLRDF